MKDAGILKLRIIMRYEELQKKVNFAELNISF